MTGSDELTVEVIRNRPNAVRQTYKVPQRDNQTVLDVVTWIQRNVDSSLSYRFACRVGMCGSCAMTVNGRPRWTCRTHVSKVTNSGKLTIAPLANLPVVKDLVVDMKPFFRKWQKAKGTFLPSLTRREPLQPIRPDSPERLAADAGIECINCGVCYASCDTVSRLTDFLGPAALNRAWTLANDVRDGGNKQRMQAVTEAGGCHSCHSHQSCQRNCPQGLNPTASIAGLKRLSLVEYLKGGLK